MQANVYITTKAEKGWHTETQPLTFSPDMDGQEKGLLNLYPDIAFDSWEGFGCALTEASGSVYAQMNREQQHRMIHIYFSPDEMGYNRVRIHLDSCDFCTDLYEADGDPEDATLANFDFSRTERMILPMLRDAEAAAGQKLRIMLSPWSPPAYMKSNGQRCHGGHLLPEYYARWAEYLCRYIQEFEQRGFLVERMSLQNEAKAVQPWDSCVFTSEEERAFLKVLTKALARHGLDHVEVFLWDHNKERAFERADAVLKGKTDTAVAGVACHWYSGDHFENLDLLRQRYPQLRLILSESCIEYQFFAREDTGGSACRLAHELIGDMNHGITAFYDWNLLLDETGGPNHAGNYCWAPFLYDRASGQLMPQLLQTFYWHFSNFIPAGALRIALSRYTDQIDAAAYRRPDGSLAVVLLNRSQDELSVTLRLREQTASVALPVGGIVTCEIWDGLLH
ncbi:MAG: glucosylceramidase [Clostridiales bacterium]|nr:glucosylceramidase [Clostridiales bacterium]